MLRRFCVNYVARHRHPGNIAFHVVGLPVTFVLPVVLLIGGQTAAAGLSFAVGYALQFAGHAVEGNDAGEIVLFKKWLGRPYREFGPGRNGSPG
ncbi:MAG: Mpo1-like protein [Planctomycetota bacterium]